MAGAEGKADESVNHIDLRATTWHSGRTTSIFGRTTSIFARTT